MPSWQRLFEIFRQSFTKKYLWCEYCSTSAVSLRFKCLLVTSILQTSLVFIYTVVQFVFNSNLKSVELFKTLRCFWSVTWAIRENHSTPMPVKYGMLFLNNSVAWVRTKRVVQLWADIKSLQWISWKSIHPISEVLAALREIVTSWMNCFKFNQRFCAIYIESEIHASIRQTAAIKSIIGKNTNTWWLWSDIKYDQCVGERIYKENAR